MTVALSDGAARALLDSGLATAFPAGSLLELRSGASPGANTAPGGTLLCSITLPATPWAAAAARSKAKNGTWSGTGAAGAGAGTLAQHYRLKLAGDNGTTDATQVRQDGTVVGPVAGSGTVTASAGAATFSSSQAGVIANGSTVNVAGTNYIVSAFNGTTGATLSGAPTFGASSFTSTAVGDMVLDNATIANAQSVTINSFSDTL